MEQCDESLQVRCALDHGQVQGQRLRLLQAFRFIRGRGFYYPEDRSLYCEGEECGKAASREFSARAFDEENNTSI